MIRLAPVAGALTVADLHKLRRLYGGVLTADAFGGLRLVGAHMGGRLIDLGPVAS